MQPRVTVHEAAVKLDGPLLFMRRTLDVGLGEAVEVAGADGLRRLGRVAALDDELVTIELLEPSVGLALVDTVVRFLGTPIEFGVGPGLLGRIFDGSARSSTAVRRWRRRKGCASTACRSIRWRAPRRATSSRLASARSTC